jgi:tetratricopeptide (TPR) repeat protein
MDELTSIVADHLFSAGSNHSAQMESLANQALSSGIDKYQNNNFKGAAQDFKRAFGLSPYSGYAYEATKYLSMAYEKLGAPEKAIKAYTQAISLNPTDDRLQLELGKLHFTAQNYSKAIQAYEEAVRLFDDSTNRYALGEAYLKTGRYSDAEIQFTKIIQKGGLESRNGHFGLGKTYSAQKKYMDAMIQFERAIQKDRSFVEAYAEMGFTFADAGDFEKAKEIEKFLEYKDAGLASTLSKYISKTTSPKVLFAYANSTFPYFSHPNTSVAALHAYLSNAGASRTFDMTFQFNKPMDRQSVENKFNWTIQRSTEGGPGMRYNNGLATGPEEIVIPPYPRSVYYDGDKMSATVRFDITQNPHANGTIDPSHIVFSFKGLDTDGNPMDASYDQYMGFSGSF